MIELTSEFVATTDDVSRLQQGDDPECVFFQEMADHGHAGGRPGSSRQGMYVCAPSGRFLASVNDTSPDRVLQMLRDGLAAWQKLADDQRRLSEASAIQPRHRWENSYPSDGLVVHVFTRDLPLQCDPAEPCAAKWNQDYLWFSRHEARAWLGQDPELGDVHALPDPLVARMAQFHLVDYAKGETPYFRRDGVANSYIETEVMERNGPIVRLKISGETQGNSGEGWWQTANGVVARIHGRAKYDLDKNAFVEFEFIALGRRWGQTRFNGRGRDLPSGPLGYVFRLASPDAPHVAPAHIGSYGVDWIAKP